MSGLPQLAGKPFFVALRVVSGTVILIEGADILF